MVSSARHIMLIAGAAVLAGCSNEPVAPASPRFAPAVPSSASTSVERFVEERLTNLDGVIVQLACEDGRNSEQVVLEGQVFVRETITINPSGTIIATNHSMPIGVRGVGVDSRQEYRVKELNHFAVSQREVGYAGTDRSVFELTNRATRETFKLVVVSHFVVAPQPGSPFGKVVVDRETVRMKCGT